MNLNLSKNDKLRVKHIRANVNDYLTECYGKKPISLSLTKDMLESIYYMFFDSTGGADYLDMFNDIDIATDIYGAFINGYITDPIYGWRIDLDEDIIKQWNKEQA